MRSAASAQRSQRGVILLVALLAVIALAYASIALVRAVATGVAIGSNLATRQQAALAASAALEQDVATLFEAGAIDPSVDDITRNYFAARQPGEDRRGVPHVLHSIADYPAGAPIVDIGDGYHARHVIERLCVAPGEATTSNCTMSPPSVEAASGAPPPGEPARLPYYRVTIRIDGAASSAAFVQAVLSAAHPNPRLSWRVLDE